MKKTPDPHALLQEHHWRIADAKVRLSRAAAAGRTDDGHMLVSEAIVVLEQTFGETCPRKTEARYVLNAPPVHSLTPIL